MRRFGDSNLILKNRIRFTVKVARLLGKLDSMVEFTDTHFVFIRAAQCSVISCNTFQRMARLKQVKLGLGMVGEQLYQWVAKALPQAALNKSATALTTKQ